MSGLSWLFAKGVVLGLSLAAPIGPMALLCLRTTLAQGFAPGLTAGLGVALGDAAYAAIAAFGLHAAQALLSGQAAWLGLLGGAYLLWFGIGVMRQPLPLGPARDDRRHGLAMLATTFLLTLANPPTIMTFAAMFAGLGLAEAQGGTAAPLAVVAGVLIGSGAWWVVFALVVNRMRERLQGPLFVWINRISGAALVAFGLVAVTRALA